MADANRNHGKNQLPHALQQFKSWIINPTITLAAASLLLYAVPSSTLPAMGAAQAASSEQSSSLPGSQQATSASGENQKGQTPRMPETSPEDSTSESEDSSRSDYDVLVRKMRCKRQGQDMCFDALMDKLQSSPIEREEQRARDNREREGMGEEAYYAVQRKKDAVTKNKRLIFEAWDIIHRVSVCMYVYVYIHIS